jgi:hypothetical protein
MSQYSAYDQLRFVRNYLESAANILHSNEVIGDIDISRLSEIISSNYTTLAAVEKVLHEQTVYLIDPSHTTSNASEV